MAGQPMGGLPRLRGPSTEKEEEGERERERVRERSHGRADSIVGIKRHCGRLKRREACHVRHLVTRQTRASFREKNSLFLLLNNL